MTTSVDRSFTDETRITSPLTCVSAIISKGFRAARANQAPDLKTAVELDAVIQAVARSRQSYNGIACAQRLNPSRPRARRARSHRTESRTQCQKPDRQQDCGGGPSQNGRALSPRPG